VVMHLFVMLISGAACLRCFAVGRRPGLHAWRWFGLASAAWSMTQGVGFYHVWQSDDSRAVVWSIEFLTAAGLICAMVAVAKLLVAPSGFDRPIEARIDGLLAGLAAANVASEFLLSSVERRVNLSTGQNAAFFTIQLILVCMVAMIACSIVWQAGPEAKASFACLLGASAIQVVTFKWNAVDLGQEFDQGNGKILRALLVYGLIVAATWFAVRARRRQSGAATSEPNWLTRSVGVPGLCVLIQLGIVIRIAFDHRIHWAAVALLVPSFILIAYRMSVSASLAHRLTERTHELDRMGALVEMSRTIAEAGNLDRIMQQLADASARAMHCDRARVAVFNRVTNQTRWFTNEGDGRSAPGEDYAQALAAAIGARTAPFSITTAELPQPLYERWRTYDRHTGLVAPLHDEDQLIGFVELWDNDQDWSFAQQDVDVAAAMAEEASLAIRHASALEAARRSAEDRALILRVSQAAASVLELGAVADEIVQNSLGVAGAESCAIELWHPEDNEFEVIADCSIPDWSEDDMTGTRHPGDDNLIYDYAFKNNGPIVIRRGDPEASDPKLQALMDHWSIGSAVTFPLRADGRLIGLLECFSRRVDAFDSASIRLGEQIAAQASLAIQHAHMFAVAKRNADERAVLLRVSQAATSSSSMREMLDQIAAVAIELRNVETCSMRLWHPESQILERVAGVAVAGWDVLDIVDARLDARAIPDVFQPMTQRTPLLVDLGSSNVHESRRARLASKGIGTMLIVPLWLGDACVGECFFASREEGAFDEDIQRLGQEIGQLTAVAIQRARAHEDMRQLADEQAAMLQVSQLIGMSLDQRQVFAEITAAGLTLPGIESCQLELWHSETDQLEIAGTSHVPEWWAGSESGTILPAKLWPSTMSVIHSRQPLFIAADSPFLTDYEREILFVKAGTGSGLIVPVVSIAQCVGTLTFYSRTANAFSDRHKRLGLNLANQAAIAIERARIHEVLEEQALTDGLTGLLNHRALHERLDVEITRANREKRPVAALMIDVDSFKEINDAFGHIAGDNVLQEVARTLRRSVRATDHVGRYGGDEFMIILPGAEASEALTAAERLVRLAEATEARIGSTSLRLKLSVGFAVYPLDANDSAGLIAAADRSMYSAKRFDDAGPRALFAPNAPSSRRVRRETDEDAALDPRALSRRRPL
jgi:diguanylate cyclase (GGDEF)-like protein